MKKKSMLFLLSAGLLLLLCGCDFLSGITGTENSTQQSTTIDHEHVWINATCTEPFVCEVCGETKGEPYGHSWIEATCTACAYCEFCNKTKGEPIEHDWKEATCTSPKTCKVCGMTSGSKASHTWTVATCTKAKTCTVCGITSGSSLGHSWVAPTCTSPKTCTICGATSGSRLGHSWVAATCMSPKTCSRCNITDGQAGDHTWEDATCTEPKKCKTCGKTEGDCLGHTYEETITKEATSLSKGEKKYTCSRCGNSYTQEYSLQESSLTVLTAEEIYQMAETTVGEIITYDKSGDGIALGTGFLISSDGKIVTNFHVIDEAYSIKITFGSTTYTVQKILAYDKDIDLAVLKINVTGLDYLKTSKSDVKGGSTVYAVGSSEGFTLSISSGIVASPNRTIDGVHFIQHEAPISSGNSGGPLINTYGEVIGINTMTYTEGQNINFAIHFSEYDNLNFEKSYTMTEFYEEEGPLPYYTIGDYMVNEREENNDFDSAQSLPVNGTTVSGKLSYATDFDFYQVYLEKGQTLYAILIPELNMDAEWMLFGIFDSETDVVTRGSVETVGDNVVKFAVYENTSASGYFYIALIFDQDYKYKNVVANYVLYFAIE